MLEAFDLESFDLVFLFRGAITKLMCRNSHNLELTQLVTFCVEILMFVGSDNGSQY